MRGRFKQLIVAAWLMSAAAAVNASLVVVDDDHDVSSGVLRVGGGSCCGLPACRANFRLDNQGDGTYRDVAFTVSDLTGSGGVLPAAALSFHPASLPKLGASGSKVITVSVELPAGLGGGDYHGVITIAAGGGAASVELKVTVSVCAAPASLRVVPLAGQHDGERVALAAAAGCAGTRFMGRFEVEADGGAPLTAVVPGTSGLPPGAVAKFTPPSLRLSAGERGWFEVEVIVPTDLVAGDHTGLISLRDAESGAAASTPLSFSRCRARVPSLRIVASDDLALSPDTALGCAGVGFVGEVRVTNDGDVALAAVGLHVTGLPSDFVVRVSPSAVSLAPGGNAIFKLSVELEVATAVGLYRASLLARDDATGASDVVALSLEHCASPSGERPEPPIVEPLPGLSGLALRHVASRGAVLRMEILSLETQVSNQGAGTLRDFTIEQHLPPGFTFVAGRSVRDGEASADPRIDGSVLSWRISSLGSGRELNLGFQVTVSPRARSGQASSTAYLRTPVGDLGPAEALIQVGDGSRFELGLILGEVRRSDGTPVSGARVLLDSAREAVSDEHGGFRFAGLAGGDHLVSLDPRSLGSGARAVGGDSRLLHLFRGSSERVSFTVQPRPVLHLSLERIDADETVEGAHGP